jgi:hypothetical protein
MGAGVFHGRVRDGIGCIIPAMTTGPPNRILDVGWDGWCVVLGVCGVRGLVLRAVLVLVEGTGCCGDGCLWWRSIGRLGPLGCMHCCTSTCGLST